MYVETAEKKQKKTKFKQVNVSAPEKVITWPPKLEYHTASLIEGKIYIFGGMSKFGPSNELWSLDTGFILKYFVLLFNSFILTWFFLGTMNWTKIEAKGDIPPERFNHSAILIGRMIYICGGKNDFGNLSDSYMYHIGK